MPVSPQGLDPMTPNWIDLRTAGVTTPDGEKPFFVWASLGAVVLATAGTDSACTNGTVYYSSLWLPCKMTLTGISYMVGSVGGTDKVIVTLHDSTGAVVANSAVAGTTVGTAANMQSVDFTATYAANSGRYYIGVTFNGTTAKFRTYPIPGSKAFAGSATQTFGTTAAFTPPGTFTADKGPIGGVY